jgi:protein-disulfide isomerase
MDTTRFRREFLALGGAAATAALAGCSGGGSNAEPIVDGDRPARGDESAPVTVTAFEDFSCPHCRRFHAQVVPAIVDQYVEPGDVRYLHADFPIPVNERWSYAVAGAARAVFETAGSEGFWPFAAEIFPHQGSYSLDVVESVAAETADAGEAARTAAADGTYREEVEADRERGQELGVNGTPTVFVDDEQVEVDAIGEAIESRL